MRHLTDQMVIGKHGIKAGDLIDQGRCPCCAKVVRNFKDELSRREFKISGLCQRCQDEVFGC